MLRMHLANACISEESLSLRAVCDDTRFWLVWWVLIKYAPLISSTACHHAVATAKLTLVAMHVVLISRVRDGSNAQLPA
jgi:hypothetical protein